jgi:hypothetical protein
MLTENNGQDSKTSSQTAVEMSILRSKRNEDIREGLERNLQTQVQLQKKKVRSYN